MESRVVRKIGAGGGVVRAAVWSDEGESGLDEEDESEETGGAAMKGGEDDAAGAAAEVAECADRAESSHGRGEADGSVTTDSRGARNAVCERAELED